MPVPFVMPGFQAIMPFKVTAKEVEKIVDKLDITPSGEPDEVPSDSVGIAAVQLFCKRYVSLTDYIVDMNLYVADAVNRRANLVCFPAFTGLLSASFLPQFNDYMTKLRPRDDSGMPDVKALGEALTSFSDPMFNAYFFTMSALAARHRVYIMAGSAIYFEENEPRHRAFLFAGDGQLVGFQDKLGLTGFETALQIEPAHELKVFDTPMGPLSILTGSDVDYFETARIAKKLGAKIILNPNLFMGEYTPVDASSGLSLRVQESGLYGVQSTLVGDTGLDFTAEGPACVFAPRILLKSRSKNGVAAQSSGRQAPDIVHIRLNLDSLDGLQNPYAGDTNPALMEKYIDRLY